MRPAPAPDLPPAVAERGGSSGDAVKAGLVSAAAVLAFAMFRERSWVPGTAGIVIALLTGLVLGLGFARSRTTAGPGWLSHQGLVGRVWVRTDQLARVQTSHSLGDPSVQLRDRAGRELTLSWSTLSADQVLLDRLRADVQASLATGADLDAPSRVLLGDAEDGSP